MAFFPGCTIPGVDMGYEASARKVFKEFNVILKDVEDFSCCAPSPIATIDKNSALAISARNLCIAENLGLDIITFCNGCFETLKHANVVLKNNKEQRSKINAILAKIGYEFKGTIKVKHGLQVLIEDITLEKVKNKVKINFYGLKIAAFYGCHITRPSKILKFDNTEDPTALDDLIKVLGAENVDFEGKRVCCGGFVKGLAEQVAIDLIHSKLKALKEVGADAVIVACPFCFFQFDSGQKEILRDFGEKYDIPVLNFTDLLGIALDIDTKSLGLNTHRVKVKSFLQKIQSG
ncbi:MAG: CoB--CoM heterodisulfide reductase iron-sulfur subunit B family protein [Candidatus Helarchaeota archaeon]